MAHKYDVTSMTTACRLLMVKDLASNMVAGAVEGHLSEDEELKNAAISLMGKQLRPLEDLPNWDVLQNYPDLSLEIAERIKKNLSNKSQ